MRAPVLLLLVLFVAHCSDAPVAAQRGGGAGPPRWKTLSGNRPVVVARGGFSGLFPDSSVPAFSLVPAISLENTAVWCDLQVTKDGVGICLPDLDMQNSTDIRFIDSPVYRNRTYRVNDKMVTGWFPSDYTAQELLNVSLIQGMFSRPPNFDGLFPINGLNVQTFNSQIVWVNVQHASFYSQQKLSVTKVLLSARSNINIGYISSPEVFFLQSVGPTFRRTKLIFRVLSDVSTEPSTNQSYTSLLKNLTFVKTFASGILIPKNYIWPSTGDYLGQGPTTIVTDAHKAGLEVFVSGFVNDAVVAFNYSYNPTAEYLNFINLGNASDSVDGFVSDFPATASGAIGCFSHMDGTSNTGKPMIISHNGASGDYPGCTDLAYNKAIDDGADYIDCPVQFTKDGSLICMSSPNLMTTTTVTNSPFSTRFSTFPEFQETSGIYTFNLTWDEIQNNMKPVISSPQLEIYKLVRNPAHKNDGKFMTLNDFLKLALSSSSNTLKGVVITIENAAFLAEKLGFNVTEFVINTIDTAGFNKQTKLEVLIQSSNSSSLIPFKEKTKFKILYKVTELISNIESASLDDIKKFADAVAVRRQTIFPSSRAFITTQTKLVERLHSANLTVYSYLLMNEFVNPPWDFFADPIIEIHNHVAGASVDGVITDYPESASLYRRNTCARENYNIPLVQPGGLLTIMTTDALPPALAPFPPLTESEVSEPPLPPALKPTNSSPAGSGTPTRSGQLSILPSFVILAMSLALFLVFP